MIVLLLLLGCSRPDPELVAQHDAIAAWELGKTALQQGDPGRARTHFKEAREIRPRDGLLFAWEAQAARQAGDLDGAIGLLEEGLALQPGMVEARYALAACLVEAGRPEDAAVHLQRALVEGELPARDVLDDPDFSGVLAHPAFSFLPATAIEVALDVPDGPIFWGSQALIELVVRGGREPEVDALFEGPAQLVSGVFAVEGAGAERVHRYTWTLLALGQTDVRVQASVRDGDREVAVEPATFASTAPPGKESSPSVRMPLPDRRAAEGVPIGGGAAGPGMAMARTTPAQRVTLEPSGGRLQRFELREGGTTSWTLHRWIGLKPGSYDVVVREPGQQDVRQGIQVTAEGSGPG